MRRPWDRDLFYQNQTLRLLDSQDLGSVFRQQDQEMEISVGVCYDCGVLGGKGMIGKYRVIHVFRKYTTLNEDM